MAVKDMTRWVRNPDGSWSRQLVNSEKLYFATAGAEAAAAELGVDLATVIGTGARGKITKADVETAASKA